MASSSRSRQPQIIEILDSDDEKEHDSSATDNSDVELVVPRAPPPPRASTSRSAQLTIPASTATSSTSNDKGKGRATDLDAAWDHYLSDLKTTTSAKNASLRDGVGSSSRDTSRHSRKLAKLRDNDNVHNSAVVKRETPADAYEDEDADAAYARRLYQELNGDLFDGYEQTDTGIEFSEIVSKKRKRYTPSSSGSELDPGGAHDYEEEGGEESDEAFAARLAREEEQAEAKRKELEESDALYAKTVYAADEVADRIRREKLAKTGEKIEKIAYQVTMDGDGKTIEGDEDAENMNQYVVYF